MYGPRNYLKKTDHFLWILTTLCTGYGIVVLYSVQEAFAKTHRIGGLKTHVVATAMGFIGMLIVSIIDYKKLASLWQLHTVLTYALVLSLFFIGKGVAGSDNINWIRLPFFGGMTIQPTEFLKISFILTYAFHIDHTGEKLNHPLHLLLLLLHGLVPVVLIHQLGDDGVALIFVAIMVVMLIAGGLRWFYVLAGGVAGIGAFALAWKLDIINTYQKLRFLVLIDPSTHEATAYQQMQSLTSMGSGGLFGQGLFSDEKYMHIPVVQNDFIISFIGQALGLIGTALVVVLLTALMLRVLAVGIKSISTQGRVICAGVFGMLAFQTIINIGMCINKIPVIGITLPFFSQGGSSMLSVLVAMGLVISVHMNNEKKTIRFSRYT